MVCDVLLPLELPHGPLAVGTVIIGLIPFSALPISATGTLTYALAANATGTANVAAQVQDNGGTGNGGVDTSAAQTFTITAAAVNDGARKGG